VTAPTPTETPEDQAERDFHKRNHKLCAVQAMAAKYGLARLTLCGKVMTGPQRATGGRSRLQPCPLCFEIVAEHRASCPACQQAGWT
jgi:hypothetical protein